jgi:hypothetical protein
MKMLVANLHFLGMVMVMMVKHSQSSSAFMKTEYVIGGWAPRDWNITFTIWEPIFETYLTETVGLLYDPPISFKLVPVDYTEESSFRKRIEAGEKIDFLCELLDFFLLSTNRKVC